MKTKGSLGSAIDWQGSFLFSSEIHLAVAEYTYSLKKLVHIEEKMSQFNKVGMVIFLSLYIYFQKKLFKKYF